MKAKLALLYCLFCATALAGPARPVNSGTFLATSPCGPAWDPLALQGQWFMDPVSGASDVNTWEYCDDDNSLTIAGVVQNINFATPGNTNSNILGFDILVTVFNSLPADFQGGNASNSHNEVQLPQPPSGGEEFMTVTRITAEFAIADQALLPIGTPPYWPDPVSGGTYYIEAINEDLRAWYCWDPNQTDQQFQPPGAFQVPAWNLIPSTIPPGGTAQCMMSFQIFNTSGAPGMPVTDYRHSVIRASQQLGLDVLYNRHRSLKISHWLDTLLIDSGSGNIITAPPGQYEPEEPPEYIYASDASVFYNIQEVPPYDHKMHWPQHPDPNGWDVRACLTPATDIEPEIRKVLADDFLCTSNGLINHITFWGSWFSNLFMDVTQHPYQGITNIHLSIHADIPAGELAPWSMPGPLLWTADIDPAAPWPGWTVLPPFEEQPSWQGWYDPNTGYWATNNHDRYFRYEIYIPNEEAFQQISNTIYWLDISVATTNGLWGWKTSGSPHFNDDAVWADLPVTNFNQWQELRNPTNDFESLDLAFVINEFEPGTDWGDAPDPSYPTLNANSGANHATQPGMYLGAGVDNEPDGQPNANATGDDTNINGLGGIAFPTGDEDGVSWTQLVPGLPATITVTASQPGFLDAWIDYNADGAWAAVEQLTGASIALNTGNNLINITVPSGTTPVLSTFARFRYSSAGGLGPTGVAPDGEVEDYEMSIDDLFDWGDAPDAPYPTLGSSGGAYHLITGPYMGNAVDPEFDGQPTLPADGDDTDPEGDDEDGVTFTPPYLIPGAVAQVDVVMNGAASAPLDAWVDFNVDGIWSPGEKIFNSFVLSVGNNSLYFTVPTNAVPQTNTYARFRVSSGGGLTPAGFAQDGEVEDYRLDVSGEQPIDWADAPVSYQTLAANNGAHHVAVGVQLGGLRDAESNGIPTPGADGDDLNNLPDEDGVTFTSPVQPGGIATIRVLTSGPGLLDAWVDFNNNGGWADTGERIFAGTPLSAGTNNLSFGVPLITTNNSPGSTYARFRLSSSGVTSFAGLALDGEVEDYKLPIRETEYLGVDRGDAPDPLYPTSTNSAGANHTIIPGYILGASIDSESEGQFSANAQGDDIANIDDEDGVVFTTKIVAGVTSSVNVVCGVLPAFLDAWVDFNADGDWLDSGEQIFSAMPVFSGVNTLSFTPPIPAKAFGQSFARFRLSSTGGLGVTGPAINGEVEDYMVDLYQPAPTNLVITNLTFSVSNTIATVEWTTQNNIIYQMQSSTNLVTNVWVNAGATVTGPLNSQTNNMAAEPNKFYRIYAPGTP